MATFNPTFEEKNDRHSRSVLKLAAKIYRRKSTAFDETLFYPCKVADFLRRDRVALFYLASVLGRYIGLYIARFGFGNTHPGIHADLSNTYVHRNVEKKGTLASSRAIPVVR